MDEGPIILQKKVPVHSNDTVDTLSARVLAQEHSAYPEAVRLVAEKLGSIARSHIEISWNKGIVKKVLILYSLGAKYGKSYNEHRCWSQGTGAHQ